MKPCVRYLPKAATKYSATSSRRFPGSRHRQTGPFCAFTSPYLTLADSLFCHQADIITMAQEGKRKALGSLSATTWSTCSQTHMFQIPRHERGLFTIKAMAIKQMMRSRTKADLQASKSITHLLLYCPSKLAAPLVLFMVVSDAASERRAYPASDKCLRSRCRRRETYGPVSSGLKWKQTGRRS